MKKEDFDIINNYFNELAVKLFSSKDIENNYFDFIVLNDSYINYFRNRYFQENSYRVEIRNNHITFQEVLDISRNIIESINPAYLEKFDELLIGGILDVSYEDEYDDSHVRHEFYKGKLQSRLININRAFNYTDIEVMIHEFMHYVCYTGEGTKNKILGEFISVYFELYAIEYIYKNYKVDIEELFYNRRLINIFYQSSEVEKMEVPFFIYKTFGNLDENSYKDAKEFFDKYNEDNYKYECHEILKLIEKENNQDTERIEIDKAHYYLIATFLAYYFRKTSDINTVLNFVNNINNIENKDLDLIEVLKKYNLVIKKDLRQKIFESMEEYLDIFEADKRQR